MGVQIETVYPDDPVKRELMIEAHRVLREIARTAPDKRTRALALARLFGHNKRSVDRLLPAVDSGHPVREAARILSGSSGTILLGHDSSHLLQCWGCLAERVRGTKALDGIVATDAATLTALSRAIDLSRSSSPIVIEGEAGTGKSMLASAIHSLSGRAGEFVVFRGHDFDQARARARGGTIFVDSIEALDLRTQIELLELITSRDRGSPSVGVLIASRRPLLEIVAYGSIRDDLYYELNADPLTLPRLRDRERFFENGISTFLNKLGGGAKIRVSKVANDALQHYDWPGNLREFESVLRHGLAMSHDGELRLENLPARIRSEYLARPIWQRAQQYILNDEETGALDESLIDLRIKTVRERIERAPIPHEQDEFLSDLREIEAFLSSKPDVSDEHTLHVQEIRSVLRLLEDLFRISNMIKLLKSLRLSPEDQVARGVAERHLRELFDEHDRLRRGQTAALRSISRALRSPWLRVGTHLRDLALSLSADSGHRDQATSSEAQERLHRLRAFLDEGQSELFGTLPFINRTHKTWTREEWQQLVEVCRTKSEACRRARIHERTVTKYLRKFEIEERWGQSVLA